MSGYSLRVSGLAEIHGPLTASGTIRTDNDLTINDDQTAADAVLTFGQPTTNQTLKFLNSSSKFQFSSRVSVLGSLSGSSLNVDRNATVGGALTVTGATTIKNTLSGSALRVDALNTSGALVYSRGGTLTLSQTAQGSSGTLLVGQGNTAPAWRSPVASVGWYLDGTIAAGYQQGAIVTMPMGLTATSISLRAKGAPTGQALIVDVKKDGATIFSTKPQINASATTGGSAAVLSTTNITLNAELSVDVTQVGSTFAGSGLTIMLNGTRKY